MSSTETEAVPGLRCDSCDRERAPWPTCRARRGASPAVARGPRPAARLTPACTPAAGLAILGVNPRAGSRRGLLRWLVVTSSAPSWSAAFA